MLKTADAHIVEEVPAEVRNKIMGHRLGDSTTYIQHYKANNYTELLFFFTDEKKPENQRY